MDTAPRELRKLKGPQGVQKSTATPTHNQDKRMACQACYERKKRCIPAPPNRRCKYCCQENQRCVPRERTNRIVEEKAQEKNSKTPPNAYNLPLPHGIDHEVPRWSAVYSMFAEVLNLIPPESPTDRADEEGSSEVEHDNGETDSRSKKSREDTRSKLKKDQGNTIDSSITGDNALDALSGLPMSTGRSIDNSPLDKDFKIPASGHFNEGFTMYDMDALLRF